MMMMMMMMMLMILVTYGQASLIDRLQNQTVTFFKTGGCRLSQPRPRPIAQCCHLTNLLR